MQLLYNDNHKYLNILFLIAMENAVRIFPG